MKEEQALDKINAMMLKVSHIQEVQRQINKEVVLPQIIQNVVISIAFTLLATFIAYLLAPTLYAITLWAIGSFVTAFTVACVLSFMPEEFLVLRMSYELGRMSQMKKVMHLERELTNLSKEIMEMKSVDAEVLVNEINSVCDDYYYNNEPLPTKSVGTQFLLEHNLAEATKNGIAPIGDSTSDVLTRVLRLL